METYSKGDIVHIKNDGSKHLARDAYLVTSVNYDKQEAEIQKFLGSHLRNIKYKVHFSEIYLASPRVIREEKKDDNESDDGIALRKPIEGNENQPDEEFQSLRRSERIRNQPNWLSTGEIERVSYA